MIEIEVRIELNKENGIEFKIIHKSNRYKIDNNSVNKTVIGRFSFILKAIPLSNKLSFVYVLLGSAPPTKP